jgi:aspartate aminotransferase
MADLSKKILGIAPSATLALNAKAKEMKAQGIDVLNFAVGEPDFPAPKNIQDAAHKAIDDGCFGYTPASGYLDLKEAVVKKFERENGLKYEPAEIVCGSGAKPLLYAALVALLEPGDEVIFASPYWVTYIEIIKLADGVPVIVEAREEDDFEVKAEAIAEKITPKTKLLLLNTPSNPTGGIIGEEEQRKIAELVLKHNLYVISDEIYDRLVYEGEHFSFASISDEIKARTVTVNGASKTYAITGWRIGYSGAPKDLSKAMGGFISHITGNPNSIAQKAVIEAINGPQDEVARMKEEFIKRRDYFVDGLNAIEGVSCVKPKGAFYVYPNISAYFKGEIDSATKMAEHLLEKAHIAGVPGEAFGTKEHIRFSYAASMEQIEECLNRLKSAFV